MNVGRDERAICRWQARINAKPYGVKKARLPCIVFADDARRAVRDRHIEVFKGPEILYDNSTQTHSNVSHKWFFSNFFQPTVVVAGTLTLALGKIRTRDPQIRTLALSVTDHTP